MSELAEVFAARLKTLREEKHLTQTELAKRINSNKVQISRYEQGVVLPVGETVVKLADLFDVSVDYLFGRTEIANLGAYQADEITLDERRLIQALRDEEIGNALTVLAMLAQESESKRRKSMDFASLALAELKARSPFFGALKEGMFLPSPDATDETDEGDSKRSPDREREIARKMSRSLS